MKSGTLRSGTIADAICGTALPVEVVGVVRIVGVVGIVGVVEIVGRVLRAREQNLPPR